MKLTRNAITEANPDLRGQKHHFTIENAPAVVLEAMDDMLTAAGWKNDTCPLYDEGFSCGWWIDLCDIDEFKADYKAAKAGVKAFMAHQANANPSDVTIVIGDVFTVSKGSVIDAVNAFKAWHASEANEGRGGSAYWPRHSYAVVNGESLRISPNGRLWRSEGVEFTDYEGWKPQQFTTVSERNARVEDISAEAFQLTFRLSDEVTQRRTVEAAHAEALEMNEEITFVREFESLTHEQAMAYAQQWAYSNADAATKQKMFDHDHDEALGIEAVRNCAIRDNVKVLKKPVEWRNRQFLWENTWSEEYLAFRLEAAHAEALLIDASIQDVSAPLRIISDYMLRFLRNNKDAKLYEAKDRLERKIVQFVADGFDEQRLRQSLSAATGSHTREAFLSAIQL